jgi:hypothetical protein
MCHRNRFNNNSLQSLMRIKMEYKVMIFFACLLAYTLSNAAPDSNKIKGAFSKEANLKLAFRVTAEATPYIWGLLAYVKESSNIPVHENEQTVVAGCKYACYTKLLLDATRLWNYIVDQNRDPLYI